LSKGSAKSKNLDVLPLGYSFTGVALAPSIKLSWIFAIFCNDVINLPNICADEFKN
jgi:hypothetical protein